MDRNEYNRVNRGFGWHYNHNRGIVVSFFNFVFLFRKSGVPIDQFPVSDLSLDVERPRFPSGEKSETPPMYQTLMYRLS